MQKAIITYIFGKNQELLREPLFIDNDVEYICVTDQKFLKSKYWKIVYEPLNEIKSLRDKVALVKFNPFKYTNAEKIIIQDSSLQCINSLTDLYNIINDNDICLKKHTIRTNLNDELPHWISRGLSKLQLFKFKNMAKIDNINLSNIPLYECCIIGIKNNKETKELFNNLLLLMKFLGENGNMIVTQQCPFAYLLKTMYSNLKIGIIEQSKYFIRFNHNTNKRNYT